MEWTIHISEKESERNKELDKVKPGQNTQKEAAGKLGMSKRQFRRILPRFHFSPFLYIPILVPLFHGLLTVKVM